jgi:hypothetical protein
MDTIPFLNISIWLIIKIFILVILVMYSIFGLVVVKQVTMMRKTFKSGLNTFIHFLSIAHLLFTIFIFVLALIIL